LDLTDEEIEELMQEARYAEEDLGAAPPQEPHEGWEDYPKPNEVDDDEPPRRVIVLEEEQHHAIFTGPPINDLSVYRAGSYEVEILRYFDPDPFTDEELARKVRIRLLFS